MVILYVILALLLILLCSRYGVVLGYVDDEFSLLLRFGFFTFRIPNVKKKKPKEEAAPQTEKKEEKPPKEKKKKKLSLPPWNQLPELASMAMEALGRIFRSIRIDELTLHLRIASRDPFDTAIMLNYVNAAAEIMLDGGLLKVKKQDVVIYPDFCEEQMAAEGRLALSLRLYKLVAAALALLVGFLRWRRKQIQQTKSAIKAERT